MRPSAYWLEIRLTSSNASPSIFSFSSGMIMSSMQIEMPALVASEYPVLRR